MDEGLVMSIPDVTSRYHTVWIGCDDCTVHAERFAVDDGRLVLFGDDLLDHVSDGQRVTAAIHEIAGGHLVAQFNGTARIRTGEDVGSEALIELLAHVPLGRDLNEVEASIEDHARRRVVIVEA